MLIFSEKQKIALRALERNANITEVLFGGAAGGGKSWLLCHWQILRRLYHAGTRGCIGRAVLKNLKDTTLNTFFDVWRTTYANNPEGVTCKLNEQRGIIYFSNGSEIILKDLFQYPSDPDFASLGSLEITDCAIDEVTEITEKAFNIIQSRIRYKLDLVGNVPKIFCCGNPANNWVKHRFVLTKENQPVHLKDYQLFIPALVSDNPNKNFADTYTKQLQKLSHYDQLRLLQGDWSATDEAGQEFYWAFDRSKHVTAEAEYNPTAPIHISFDQNVNPYITNIVAQIEIIGNKYIVNIFDEFCLAHPKNSTRQLCIETSNKYDLRQGVFFYGDASGNKADTRSEYNDYDIVEQVFAPFISNYSNRVEKSNPPVLKRRDWLNDIYAGNVENIEIRINPRCFNLIDDLMSLKQDANGKKLKTVVKDPLTKVTYEQKGHTSDAKDYLICGLFQKIFDAYVNHQTLKIY